MVSDDGHVERGAYPFFVGAASKGRSHGLPSLPAVSAGATFMYGAFRFGWFAALFAMVGLVVTWRWVWRGAAGVLPEPLQSVVERRVGQALVAAWVVSVVSGIGVLIGQVASDAGRSLVWAAQPSSIAEVLRTTAGQLWLVAIIIAVGCGLPVVGFRLRTDRRLQKAGFGRAWLNALLALLSAETVATALEGHARTLRHATLSVPALTIHLLAVGVWVGGLGALLFLGAIARHGLRPAERAAFAGSVIRRFSSMAMVAVAAVILSGVASAALDLASPADLVNLPYGRMLLIKIVLLQIALVLAGRHLWFVPDALTAGDSDGRATAAFGRSGMAELGILALVVVAGASLMVMVPGRTAAQASAAQLDLQRQAGPYTVALSLVPNQPGDNQIAVTFLDRRSAPVRAVKNPTALLGYLGGAKQATPLAWVSDGRFVGQVTLPTAARYTLDVASGRGDPSATFSFRVRDPAASSAAGLKQP